MKLLRRIAVLLFPLLIVNVWGVPVRARAPVLPPGFRDAAPPSIKPLGAPIVDLGRAVLAMPIFANGSEQHPEKPLVDRNLALLDVLSLGYGDACAGECYQVLYWGEFDQPRIGIFRKDGEVCTVEFRYFSGSALRTKRRMLTKKEWAQVREALRRAGFWDLSRRSRFSTGPPDEGPAYILEGRAGGLYHTVIRSPERETCFARCCNALLELAAFPSGAK